MAESKTVDLGKLQTTLERNTQTLKTANTNLKKAKDAQARADSEYQTAKATFAAAVEQLSAATKVS